MSDHKQYTESFQMKYGEGDVFGHVRPAALMRYVEHVALKHAVLLGVSRQFNESHGMVFLMAKQAIEFKRMPRNNETLTFITQPEQAKRVRFRRVTLVYDATGAEVACVDSVWVLADINTHRLIRKPTVAFDAQWAPQIDRAVDMNIPKPDVLAQQGSVTASYAQCDENGHINNVNYFDIVCDLLFAAQRNACQVKKIVLNYHREVRFGESAQLQLGECASGVYIVGNKEGLPAFEAFCVL